MIPGIVASSRRGAPPVITGELAISGAAVNETADAGALTVEHLGPPYTWSIDSGALPPGWSINSVTGQIGGVATSPGTYTFTVKVEGANQGGGSSATKMCEVQIGTLAALLHCNDTPGSTTAQDATDGGAFARSGTCVVDTGSARFGTTAMVLTGNGGFSRTKASFAFGSGDFSLDFWVRPDSSGVQNFSRFLQIGPNNTNGGLWVIRASTTNPPSPFVQVHPSGSYVNAIDPAATFTIATLEWSHVFVGRKAGVWYLFVNGVPHPNNGKINAAAITQTTMYIGRNQGTSEEFAGRMDEIRVTAGACRWTQPFTPPTAPSDFPVVP